MLTTVKSSELYGLRTKTPRSLSPVWVDDPSVDGFDGGVSVLGFVGVKTGRFSGKLTDVNYERMKESLIAGAPERLRGWV